MRRLPAEWEPQSAVWMAWPRDPLTWPDRLEGARAAYLEAVKAVAPQRVELIVHPDLEPEATPLVAALDHVRIHTLPHIDSWLRDTFPITVEADGKLIGVKFRFDAWGEKYDDHALDDGLAEVLAAHLPPLSRIGTVMEGGAVDSDGLGTILTTQNCLIAGRSKGGAGDASAWEQVLQDQLGTVRVIWLGQGIAGDDTDGHVDTITRFVAPGHVITCVTLPKHPDHTALQENRKLLNQAVDAQGRPLRVTPLPLPPPMTSDAGAPLPASHANFLITNHAVLVPTFGGESDAIALETLAGCFPGRRVVPIYHCDLIHGLGGIHCLSMQIPAAPTD